MKFNQQYFDSMFKEYNTIDGNKWGINWRASQIKRIEIALEMISNILRKKCIFRVAERETKLKEEEMP